MSASVSYTFTLGTFDRNLIANFSPVSHSGGNNSSSDTGFKIETGAKGEIIIVVQKSPVDNSTSNVKVKICKDILDNAFKNSQPDQDGVKTVAINVPQTSGVKDYEIALPESFLTARVTTKMLEIRTSLAAVALPGNMLGVADVPGGRNVSLAIAAVDKTKLDADVQTQIGGRLVIELNLKLDGKPAFWSNANAPVTVSIPYKPTAQELADPEQSILPYGILTARAM